jgi:hypothetical protein
LLVLTSSGERVMTELRERLAAYIARSLESWPSGDAGIFAYTFAASWTTARSSIPRKPARRWPTPPDRTPGN